MGCLTSSSILQAQEDLVKKLFGSTIIFSLPLFQQDPGCSNSLVPLGEKYLVTTAQVCIIFAALTCVQLTHGCTLLL